MIYETNDIYLSAYLVLKKVKLTNIKRDEKGKKGYFVFEGQENDIKRIISDYYSNSDCVLEYCNILRNVKSQAINTK